MYVADDVPNQEPQNKPYYKDWKSGLVHENEEYHAIASLPLSEDLLFLWWSDVV